MAEHNKTGVRKTALKESKSSVSKVPAVHVDPLGGSPVTESSSKIARVESGTGSSVALPVVPPLPAATPTGFDGLSQEGLTTKDVGMEADGSTDGRLRLA